MKTIKEEIEENVRLTPNMRYKHGFEDGVYFCQRWIPIEENLPEHIFHEVKQSNGNTLIFYENYLVRGYWDNVGKREDTLMATYMPYSIGYYFNVHKQTNTVNFIVTHWRPIERK